MGSVPEGASALARGERRLRPVAVSRSVEFAVVDTRRRVGSGVAVGPGIRVGPGAAVGPGSRVAADVAAIVASGIVAASAIAAGTIAAVCGAARASEFGEAKPLPVTDALIETLTPEALATESVGGSGEPLPAVERLALLAIAGPVLLLAVAGPVLLLAVASPVLLLAVAGPVLLLAVASRLSPTNVVDACPTKAANREARIRMAVGPS